MGALATTLFASLATACWFPSDDPEVSATQNNLDDVSVPAENMSLVFLAPDADLNRAVTAIETVGGQVFHLQPPRGVVARLPAGVDGILADLGVVARFDGAVDPDQLRDYTTAERRFAVVFSNRYHRGDLPPPRRLAHSDMDPAPTSPDEFESAPSESPEKAAMELLRAADLKDAAGDIEAERNVYVPYAAGTVVVSIWLPESNGTEEPSTEDWTETQITEAYEKVQAGLEAIKRHDPNADLRFILHYESAPAHGGLEGTIDCDYEFGKWANWSGGNEGLVTANVLSSILGREVTQGEQYIALRDYLNDLRDRYDADGAFVIKVAANGNGTAYLRAHASIHGPTTTLHSRNHWSVFLHEFGHIFGATDEYCPDACRSPTSLQGYLGMINANAVYRKGSGIGYNDGQGEAQPSLMISNNVNDVNGYTRGAWGWLDGDGDGRHDVVDTFPRSELEAVVDGNRVRLVGLVTDVPAMRWGGTAFSVNRIRALHYRFADIPGSPWFELAIDGTRRGRQEIDLAIGTLPAGTHTLEVRAENSQGNLEPTPATVSVIVDGRDNSAPHIRLVAADRVISTRAGASLVAETLDLDGDPVTVAFDLDGDGSYETDGDRATARFARPGIYTVRARATDAHGLHGTTELELLVMDGNALPSVQVSGESSLVHGVTRTTARFRVDASDVDNDLVAFRWITEITGANERYRSETEFSPANTDYQVELSTPISLVERGLDLLGGENTPVPNAWHRDIVPLDDHTLAIAAGPLGVYFLDYSDREQARVTAHIRTEVYAEKLELDRDRLYVLGGQMTIIDVSDLANPVEILQHRARISVHRSVNDRSETFGGNLWRQHEVTSSEKVAGLRVRLVVDHPNPSALQFQLVPPKDQGRPMALVDDRRNRRPGRNTYVFDPQNSPELANVEGLFTTGGWAIQITDESRDEGTILHSVIRFRTSHRAVEVIDGARDILGVLAGHFVVVGGKGLQVLDASYPAWTYETSRVSGTGYFDGALVDGSTAVVSSPLEDSGDDEGFPGWWPPFGVETSGLYAVDLSWPYFPRVLRVECDLAYGIFKHIGTRAYASQRITDEPRGDIEEPTPIPLPVLREASKGGGSEILDLIGFARGDADYVLGTYDGRIQPHAFGDDAVVWNTNQRGGIDKLDVTDPDNIVTMLSFERPNAWGMVSLGRGDILIPQGSFSLIVNPDDVTSSLSRVYQVTLEARDATGGVSREVRHVHLVPYNNAVAVEDMTVVAGRSTEDDWRIEVRVSDQDRQPSWDPTLLLAADLDGDGVWDGNYNWVDRNTGVATVYHRFDRPGRFEARFLVRDGFFRTAVATFPISVDEWLPVACDSDAACAEGEFCQFDMDENACGTAGDEGVCRTRSPSCMNVPFEQVCGCDDVTYWSACGAQAAGVNVAYLGECIRPPCGGPDGLECGEDSYCRYPTAGSPDDAIDTCGVNDTYGECWPRPVDCRKGGFENYVCGCDGSTYVDECSANRDGVPVDHYGACPDDPPPPPDDCRTHGCEDDATCARCFMGWTCLPEGAVC